MRHRISHGPCIPLPASPVSKGSPLALNACPSDIHIYPFLLNYLKNVHTASSTLILLDGLVFYARQLVVAAGNPSRVQCTQVIAHPFQEGKPPLRLKWKTKKGKNACEDLTLS